jgi:hypothetical protein
MFGAVVMLAVEVVMFWVLPRRREAPSSWGCCALNYELQTPGRISRNAREQQLLYESIM